MDKMDTHSQQTSLAGNQRLDCGFMISYSCRQTASPKVIRPSGLLLLEKPIHTSTHRFLTCCHSEDQTVLTLSDVSAPRVQLGQLVPVCVVQTDDSVLCTGKQAEEMTPYFQAQFAPNKRPLGRWSSVGGKTLQSFFSPFSSPRFLFFLFFVLRNIKKIWKKPPCHLASTIVLNNSGKLPPRVRRRDMMTKYRLPIVTVRWADCDSGTPIFWSLSFLGERGCDVLQVGSVGPIISLYLLPAMIGEQSGIVFFKCHSVWKWGASHDQSWMAEQMAALTF